MFVWMLVAAVLEYVCRYTAIGMKVDGRGQVFANGDLIVDLDSYDCQQTVVSDGVMSIPIGYQYSTNLLVFWQSGFCVYGSR